MKEIHYYVAKDGKKFDDRWECIEYEQRKQFEEYKDEFVFFDYRKEKLTFKNGIAEEICYIIVKTEQAAKVIGEWFNSEGYLNPFDGVYEGCVGIWVYGEEIDKGEKWYKLELEIEKLKTLAEELNR